MFGYMRHLHTVSPRPPRRTLMCAIPAVRRTAQSAPSTLRDAAVRRARVALDTTQALDVRCGAAKGALAYNRAQVAESGRPCLPPRLVTYLSDLVGERWEVWHPDRRS